MRNIVLLALALAAGGCAVGQRIVYHEGMPRLQASAPIALGLAVQELRPEVLGGRKSPDFVGVFRGGFGNPFDVRTASGRPMATDFAEVIGGALRGRRYPITFLAAPPNKTPAQLAESVRAPGVSRLLVVQIRKWRSDTYNTTKLEYDLVATVASVPDGITIGQANVARVRNLGGGSVTRAKEVIPVAYRETLTELLNAPEIVKALAPATSPE